MDDEKDEQTDEAFLNYCEAHAETPRAGFVPKQLVRLFKLAGDPKGGSWDQVPKDHIENFGDCPHHILNRVAKARELLKQQEG